MVNIRIFFSLLQVETKDGFLLSLQHIPHGKNKAADSTGPPVFLQHGLFQVLFSLELALFQFKKEGILKLRMHF